MLGFVAIAEATRPVIRAAVVPGLWLLVAPWLLGYDAPDVTDRSRGVHSRKPIAS